MSTRPSLHEFIQNELRQAEPLFEAMVDAVLDSWRHQLPSRLASDLDAPRVLLLHRNEFVRRAAGSLRDQVSRSAAAAMPQKTGRLELALVEDDEVTTDIEIARVVDRANSALENEVRELRTFTSALVGDINASRDTNPLRPEVWVRALMVGARAVPISGAMQTALLRATADPLIRAVRDTYMSACTRLQALGVQPATHRTIVNEGETIELTDAMRARRELERSSHANPNSGFAPDSGQSVWIPSRRNVVPGSVEYLLIQVEQGLAGSPRYVGGDAMGGRPPSQPAPLKDPESHPTNQTAVERLSQIFDAIMSDRRLPRDCLPLLSRYFPGAMRQTLVEPAAMDDAEHPMWRFVDQLAFMMQTRAVGDPQANLAFAQTLVDQIAANPALETRHFQSAMARVAVHERQRFARAVAAAAEDIRELTNITRHAATGFGPSLPQELDAASNDDHAAPLMRRDSDVRPTQPSAPELWKPGTWLSLFLRGQWRRALVLWRAPGLGPLLMLDATEARHWAVRRQSIQRLAVEGLARELQPRSLMRDSRNRAGKVTRESGPASFG
jgi:hypothetical protein